MSRRTHKERDAAHTAALRVIERCDSEITKETIYWRALFERCKRVAAEAEENRNRFLYIPKTSGIRVCKVSEHSEE